VNLIAAPKEIEPEVIKPEQTLPSTVEYIIPPTQPLSVEPDYNFGGIEQPAPEPQLEVSPITVPSSGSSFFDAITRAPVETTTEDPFGFGLNTPSIETPVAPEPSPFSGFDTPTIEPTSFSEVLTPPEKPLSGFEFTLSTPDLNIPAPIAPLEEESYEHYASRRRADLSGEDTISLEDYLNKAMIDLPKESSPVPPISFDMQSNTEELPTSTPIVLPETPSLAPPISTGVQNKIEELATKLQTAGKITPVINFAQKETPRASEQDTTPNVGFVTPTLAEIYAKQGWFDDAIKAYKALIRNKPAEKERFEKRIAELEKLKSQNEK
jgi:hypothetical protein